jgi:hypothetical protein
LPIGELVHGVVRNRGVGLYAFSTPILFGVVEKKLPGEHAVGALPLWAASELGKAV